MIYVYFVGTAGSGKSTVTHSFNEWCKRNGYDAIPVNLDPGVKKIPYSPEVDIREWISLEEVMKEYNLGPNGAQVVCADMLALNASELEERIREYRADYVLFDTPGQLELFAFRSAGKVIVEQFGVEKSVIAFLIEPSLSTTPANFVSQLMLSAVTQFRLGTATVNLLTKIDMIDEEALKMIVEWGKNPDSLYEELMNKSSMYSQLNEGIMNVIKEMEGQINLIPISSITWEGMEDLYSAIQNIFYGGEDLERR